MININYYLKEKTASAASEMLYNIGSDISKLTSKYEGKSTPKSFLSKVPGLGKIESGLSNITSKGLDKLGLKQKINADELKGNISNLKEQSFKLDDIQDNEALWSSRRTTEQFYNESIEHAKKTLRSIFR